MKQLIPGLTDKPLLNATGIAGCIILALGFVLLCWAVKLLLRSNGQSLQGFLITSLMPLIVGLADSIYGVHVGLNRWIESLHPTTPARFGVDPIATAADLANGLISALFGTVVTGVFLLIALLIVIIGRLRFDKSDLPSKPRSGDRM